MAIINYNPNTGAKLTPGQSVVNNQTGQTVTQGQTYSAPAAPVSSPARSSGGGGGAPAPQTVLGTNGQTYTLGSAAYTDYLRSTPPGVAATVSALNNNLQPTVPTKSVVASSDAVVANEKNTAARIAGLQAKQPNDQAVRDEYQGVFDTLKNESMRLETLRASEAAAIESSFGGQQDTLSKTQSRATGATNTALVKTGGYLGTQISGVGVLNNLAGTHGTEVSLLQAKRADALRQASQAIDEKKFAVASKMADAYKALGDEIQQRRDTYFSQSLQLVQEQRLAAAQREKDQVSVHGNAIIQQIAKGVTDPIAILQALNFDKRGNAIGSVTIDEVTKALKSINDVSGGGVTKTDFTFDNKATGKLIASGWTIPDIKAMQKDLKAGASLDQVIQGAAPKMQQSLLEALGISGQQALTVGKGASSPLEEQLIRTRLFSKLQNILNKGQLSDADRAVIDGRIQQFREAGLGEQEILDTLAGIPPEVSSPYNAAFRDIIVANSATLDKQNQSIGKISMLLNTKNYTSALNAVENIALTEAQKLDPTGYMGNTTARTYVDKIQNIRTLLDAGEAVVGPIQGSFQQILGKFKTENATKLEGAVADLTAQYRHDIAGTAITESEEKFLAPLIASLTDKEGNFRQKLNSFENGTLLKYNATRTTVSLPEVTSVELRDLNKRLLLYSNDASSHNVKSLDI